MRFREYLAEANSELQLVSISDYSIELELNHVKPRWDSDQTRVIDIPQPPHVIVKSLKKSGNCFNLFNSMLMHIARFNPDNEPDSTISKHESIEEHNFRWDAHKRMANAKIDHITDVKGEDISKMIKRKRAAAGISVVRIYFKNSNQGAWVQRITDMLQAEINLYNVDVHRRIGFKKDEDDALRNKIDTKLDALKTKFGEKAISKISIKIDEYRYQTQWFIVMNGKKEYDTVPGEARLWQSVKKLAAELQPKARR